MTKKVAIVCAVVCCCALLVWVVRRLDVVGILVRMHGG
jgi:hypothetical protein